MPRIKNTAASAAMPRSAGSLLGEELLSVRCEVLVRLLDGDLGDTGGHGHVADGLAGASALHDHVADGGGDGLGVAAHVEAVLQPPRGLLRGAHLPVAHPEPGAEAAHVVGGAHDADVHHLAGLLPEHLLDEHSHLADLLLGGGAVGGDGGQFLVRARLALVAAGDVEAGGVERVSLLSPAGARPGLAQPLVHVLGAVPDGGDEAEAVGHVGDGVKALDQRLLAARAAAGADMQPRQRVAPLALRLLRAGVGDLGDQRHVGEERVAGPADAAGVAVFAAAVVREVAPLGALVDVVRLQDERALGADCVAGGVVQHHLRRAVAVRAVVRLVVSHGYRGDKSSVTGKRLGVSGEGEARAVCCGADQFDGSRCSGGAAKLWFVREEEPMRGSAEFIDALGQLFRDFRGPTAQSRCPRARMIRS
jgi:hypothetical protein